MSLYVERIENQGKAELVMLPGWGMGSEVWQVFVEQLQPHFSLTVLDLPGLGRSESYPDPYTTQAAAEMLLPFLPKKANMLGWSMGGQIATWIAFHHPQRVEGLVTVCSNPCFMAREDWLCAIETETHSAFEQGVKDNTVATLNRFAQLQTLGSEGGREALKLLRGYLKNVKHTEPFLSLMPLREDLRRELERLTQPVLQLFGECDQLVPVEVAECCPQKENRLCKVYQGAGHLPFITHQEQVLSDVISFLQGETR